MKKQHTPGPWALLDREENSRILTHITNGVHIVCTLGTTRTDGSPNHCANAHLIAAAPDLLSALQQMLNADYAIQEGFGEKSDQAMLRISAIDSAQRAIAKAKGEV